MLILSDLHIGLKRRGGMSSESMKAYREFQFATIKGALQGHLHKHVLILGDLFDGFDVGYDDIWDVWTLLEPFKDRLILVAGNHDVSKNTDKLSALEFLRCLLGGCPGAIPWGGSGYEVIPHLPNQALFDKQIAATGEGSILFTHCNYDNGFALEADHSLNLTPEQAARFSHVIIGHEHNKRDLPGIDIVGSLYPTSISDCKVDKGYHLWDGPGTELQFVPTWTTADYIEMDWRCLDPATPEHFIRVTGAAKPEEAAMVIDLLTKFRKASSAFFITNSVKVGDIELGSIEADAEQELDSFDPMKEFLGLLSGPYQLKIKEVEAGSK